MSALDAGQALPRQRMEILPALTPRVPLGGLEPHWAQAFGGELFMWGFFVAVATFAITQNQKVLFGVIVLSLVLLLADPPPETVTELNSGVPAFVATFTVTVIAG